MDIRLKVGTAVSDDVTAISSKSYVHRLLIASALCDEHICVVSNIVSKDMEATVRALSSLGAKINIKENGKDCFGFYINSPLAVSDRSVVTDCGESGSTARFILPLASYYAANAVVTGSGRLPDRPMKPLCDVLKAAGVMIDSDHLPISVSGHPQAGEYEIAGNVSSQFISGLLFLLPLLEGRSSLKITGSFESAAYVDMTEDVLSNFNVVFEHDGATYITGRQKYKCKTKPDDIGCIYLNAEGDWSNAAYIMAHASLGSGRAFDALTVKGLNPDSIQGDRAIIRMLDDFGVDVVLHEGKDRVLSDFTVMNNPVRPVNADCSQIPDLVPVLAVLAAYADGDSVFYNIGRLRMKECDRVEAVTSMLGAVDVLVDITSDPDTGSEHMTVHGKGRRSPVAHDIIIDSFNDHRIAMAATALVLVEDRPVVIKGAEAVDKSYPGFYEIVSGLGIIKT